MVGGRLELARFEFTDEFLRNCCELDTSALELNPIYNKTSEKLTLVGGAFKELLGASDTPSTIVVEQYAAMVVRRIAREAGASFGRADDAWMHPAALRRVVDLVEAEMHADVSLGVLAHEAGLSVSALMRAFRGSLGMTPWEFILRRRIDRAARLLAETEYSVSQIAGLCGFTTQAHMTNVFKARRGQPPAAFRSKTPRQVP